MFFVADTVYAILVYKKQVFKSFERHKISNLSSFILIELTQLPDLTFSLVKFGQIEITLLLLNKSFCFLSDYCFSGLFCLLSSLGMLVKCTLCAGL